MAIGGSSVIQSSLFGPSRPKRFGQGGENAQEQVKADYWAIFDRPEDVERAWTRSPRPRSAVTGPADGGRGVPGLWRITDEIWNRGRLEVIDELVAEDLTDHVDLAGLEGSGRDRYRASIAMMRAALRD